MTIYQNATIASKALPTLLEIAKPPSEISALLTRSTVIPWFLRCSPGCLGKGGGWCDFLQAHKARLAVVFIQHECGLGI